MQRDGILPEWMCACGRDVEAGADVRVLGGCVVVHGLFCWDVYGGDVLRCCYDVDGKERLEEAGGEDVGEGTGLLLGCGVDVVEFAEEYVPEVEMHTAGSASEFVDPVRTRGFIESQSKLAVMSLLRLSYDILVRNSFELFF